VQDWEQQHQFKPSQWLFKLVGWIKPFIPRSYSGSVQWLRKFSPESLPASHVLVVGHKNSYVMLVESCPAARWSKPFSALSLLCRPLRGMQSSRGWALMDTAMSTQQSFAEFWEEICHKLGIFLPCLFLKYLLEWHHRSC